MPRRFQGADPGLDFSRVTAEPSKPKQHKPDWIEELLRVAQGVAPIAGAGIGAAVGASGGPVGALAGAGIGGGIGQGIGGLAGYGADRMGDEDAQAEAERLAKENEELARNQAVQRIMGGF